MQSEQVVSVRLNRCAGARLGAWVDAQPRPVTLTAIASEAGCTKQFVHAIVHGQSRPTEAVVDACRRLGVPVEALGLVEAEDTS